MAKYQLTVYSTKYYSSIHCCPSAYMFQVLLLINIYFIYFAGALKKICVYFSSNYN